MSVTWVNVLLTEGNPCAFIHTTEGLLIDNLSLSPLLLKTLCIDRSNRVAEGIGAITPTPWGWFWDNSSGMGKLAEPPKLSDVKCYTIPDSLNSVPLESLYLERR